MDRELCGRAISGGLALVANLMLIGDWSIRYSLIYIACIDFINIVISISIYIYLYIYLHFFAYFPHAGALKVDVLRLVIRKAGPLLPLE